GDDNYVPPIERCDHRIAIHPRATRKVLWEHFRRQDDPESAEQAQRLGQALVDEWRAEAESCRREYRFLGAIAALREACRVVPTPEIRRTLGESVAFLANFDRDLQDADALVGANRFTEAIALYERILKVKPDSAVAHGKLGTA